MDGFEGAVARVGSRIRQLRQLKGLTQKQLAEMAGIFDVGELERGLKAKGGISNPGIETLHKVALALEVDVEELFGQAAVDEESRTISALLQDADPNLRKQAVRVIQALVEAS